MQNAKGRHVYRGFCFTFIFVLLSLSLPKVLFFLKNPLIKQNISPILYSKKNLKHFPAVCRKRFQNGKTSAQTAGTYSRTGKRPRRLQGHIPEWENARAVCRGIFQNGKTSAQSAGAYSRMGIASCSLHGRFPDYF